MHALETTFSQKKNQKMKDQKINRRSLNKISRVTFFPANIE